MRILLTDIEPLRLELRLVFLQDRAQAHLDDLQEETNINAATRVLYRACAATLLRDAACVALLLGQTDAARALLSDAGRHFLTLGMPFGAGLLALADIDQAGEQLSAYEDLIQDVRQQRDRTETLEREYRYRPMSERARGEPRQLLGIMQADWLLAERGGAPGAFTDSEAMRTTLYRAGGYAAGVTGLSIDSYVRLAEEFVWPTEAMAPEKNWVERSLATFYAARSENLNTARKDAYHWRILPRPAELVDLDATILMFLALGTSWARQLREDAHRRDDPILDAPLHIAEALRRDEVRDQRL